LLEKKLLKIIDNLWLEFWQTAKFIYDSPELGGKEFKAVNCLIKLLEKYDFEITCPYLELPTAFKAELGKRHPVIYLLAEYDALPEIGHGCGHHLIAGASVGAAIALAVLKKNWAGKIVVLGTPAEETDGGKVFLVERGAFRECDAALMFHPGQTAIINISSLALDALEVEFTGVYGHSAGQDELGNPLVSLVDFYQNTLLFNKVHTPKKQIQGVITAGGITPNLIPREAVGKFYLRAISNGQMKEAVDNFRKMAQRSANMNRTQVVIRRFEPQYLPMNTNTSLANIFARQAKYLGLKINMQQYQIVGSMDMGNVSWEVPAIHPYLPLGKGNVSAHTPEFAKKAGEREGERTMKIATSVLALTALQLLTQPYLIDELWKEHRMV